MRKLIVMMLMVLPMITLAQTFYQPSELRVELLMWESESDIDYLVDNGKPVSWTYNFGIGNPMGFNMFATYCYNNKFITISFQNDNRIYLCDQSNVTSFENYYGEMYGLLEYLPWFSGFKYSKIVYDIWWNRILIPVGTDQSSGQSYAISIYFDNINSSAQDIKSENDFNNERISYYNLNGQMVDLESTKGQIIIKTDGQKYIKILNK